jgi:release factor glutamine methyltransferase
MFFGIDISSEALKVAKQNAKLHNLAKKIKFLQGSLLDPIMKEFQAKKLMPDKLIVTANLPYLSKEIYSSAPIDVKKFEPKSALYSPEEGLQHYRKLLEQVSEHFIVVSGKFSVVCYLEISPEQKIPLQKLVTNIFPSAKTEFTKDLAGKWRICKIDIAMSSRT